MNEYKEKFKEEINKKLFPLLDKKLKYTKKY